MSDTQDAPLLRIVDSDARPEPVPAAVQAGALLRGYREQAGHDIEALAAIVKVPVRRLQALEAGSWDLMPEHVYLRALIVGICRVLKADAQPVLVLLPPGAAQPLKKDGTMEAVAFSPPGTNKGYGLRDWMSKPHMGWALVFVIGSGLLYGFPEITVWLNGIAADADVPTLVRPLVAPEPVARVVSTPEVDPPPADEAPAPVLTPAAANGKADAVGGTSPAGPLSSDMLALKAHGRTWVEVLDAKGVVVLRRHLEDGERVGVRGQPPLAVVVGRAEVTEVWVRGKVMDIKAISQDNVARFEVK